MGKADYLKLGDWNAICDRCGSKRKSSDLKETWDHLMVCGDTCWEPRHISDFYRVPEEDTSVPWSRPERPDSSGTTVSGDNSIYLGGATTTSGNQTLTVGTDPTVQIWSADLTANVTVTLDTTGAQLGDRFKIYRTGAGAFTFDIGGLKTSGSGITFEAEVEYNGTTWTLISYTTLGL